MIGIRNVKRIAKYVIYNIQALFLYFFSRQILIQPPDGVIFITHNLGGGTENYVKDVQQENSITILRKIGFGRDRFFELSYENKKKIIKENQLFEVLKGYQEYFINSLVGFSMKMEILSFLLEEKQRRDIHLWYVLHDFDCICKNNFNLIRKGYYCKLNCQLCELNDDLYTKIWKEFLMHCDEIRCFSLSSSIILRQRYTSLAAERIKIVPHNIDYCNFFSPLKIERQELHIGFVGNCNSISKGRDIVVPFLGYCKKNKIKVTVIGKFNVENRVYGERIQYLGKYRNTDLGNILQQSGVNVVFFTSVWPETFSYLISELMALNIPICCFDIGAQGEKIGGYEYGHLIHYGDAENMFRQIAAFWKSLE
ncbi:MAG: glycosyltransferase [Spirochaetaceae bacterium]|nr:glycosyltransferase [Spirochaetaceae bacterium]